MQRAGSGWVELLRKRFGVLVNERARVKLFGWDEEFKGLLVLDSLLIPESKKDEVPLRIGRVTSDCARYRALLQFVVEWVRPPWRRATDYGR